MSDIENLSEREIELLDLANNYLENDTYLTESNNVSNPLTNMIQTIDTKQLLESAKIIGASIPNSELENFIEQMKEGHELYESKQHVKSDSAEQDFSAFFDTEEL